MSTNIDLGTFNWDTNKIEDKIAANTLEMGKFSAMIKSAKDQIKEQSKTISELEKKIESERKSQERLNKYLKEGTISQEKYNYEVEKSNNVIDQYITEQMQASKAQADAVIVQNKLQQSTKELRLENNELNKLLSAGRTELSGLEGVYRNTNAEMNATKIEAKNLGIQLNNLEKEGKANTEEYKKLAAQYAEVSARANAMNDVFKKVDKSVGDNWRTVGDYKDQIKSAASEITVGFNQILSGNIIDGFNTLKQGIGGVITNVKGLWASMLANPITAILVAVTAITSGIAAGAKAIIDYNESIKENIKLVENLTGTTGKAADEIRNRATGLSKTFNDEFNEVVKTANVLAKQLGISYDRAFDQIENGYVRGANANGDFLERLREYGPLLAKYGFDIEEIIGLQVQAQQQGIFNDKFEDSLKESGIALEEFTKAQADALTSAFGPEFSNKINKGINSGALTVKDALLLIAKEADKRKISIQEFGILTADVFKGAGEDAGGAQAMFENLYAGLKKGNEPLTELQKKTKSLSEANFELVSAKDEAFKSDVVIEFLGDIDLLQIKIETAFYKIIGWFRSAVTWFDEITGASESLGETWDMVIEYASSIWQVVEDLVDVFSDLFKALGLNNDETKDLTKSFFQTINPLNILKGLFAILTATLRNFSKFLQQSRVDISAFAITVRSIFSQIVDAAKSFIDLDFEGGLNKLKNINISKEFATARKEAERIAALNKKTDPVDNTPKEKTLNTSKTQAEKDAEAKAAEEARKKAESDAKKAETKRIADAKKAAEEAKKLMIEEAKRTIELQQTTAEQASQIAKTELAEYISMNAAKFDSDKRLTSEKLALQKEYLDSVKEQQQQINALEFESKEKAIQLKIEEIDLKLQEGKRLTENDILEKKLLNDQIAILTKEFQQKDLELEVETMGKKKELDKTFQEQQIEEANTRRAIEFQQKLVDLENNNKSEYAANRAQIDEQKANDLITLEQDRANNLISLENYELQKKLIEDKYRLDKKKLDEEVEKSKRTEAANTFGQTSQLLGEETTIGKAAAIAEIGMNGINAVQSAYTTAQKSPITVFFPAYPIVQAGLAAAFSAKQAAKIAGFADGGLISDGFPIIRSNGDDRLITAKTGEVILNEDQQAALGGHQVFKMLGVPGFATGGVVGTPSSALATVQNSIVNNNVDYQAMAGVIREAVIEGATIGTHNGSQSGIGDLSTNTKIAANSNY